MIPEGRNPWATLSVSRRGSVVVVRVGTELIEVVGEGMDVIEEVGSVTLGFTTGTIWMYGCSRSSVAARTGK